MFEGVDRYSVALLDPPWSYTGSPTKWAAAGKHYSLMPDESIYGMPLGDILNRPAVVFVWATGPMLHKAVKAIDEWGLYYRGVAFVWVKTKQDGTPIGAQGVRPSIVKPLTEFVLVGSTAREGRPLPLGSEAVVQTVFAPRGEHSRKPKEVINRIDDLYPEDRKIELFARGKAANDMWDTWGDEAE